MGGGAGVEGVQGARYDLEELAPTRRQVACGYFRRRCSAAHGRRAPPRPPPGVGAGESNRGGEAWPASCLCRSYVKSLFRAKATWS